jgi:hypothetical protein
VGDDRSIPGNKRKRDRVVSWSKLRIDALQATTSETIDAIERKLAAAVVSSEVSADALRELRSILESISQEIELARQLNAKKDGAD